MALKLPDGLTLYFSRHGQTQANVEELFSSRRDTPLTARGREQARTVGEILIEQVGSRPALAFVASPLRRARFTMEIVRETLGLPAEGYATDARLQEIDLGDWDQLSHAAARALDPAFFDARMADRWNIRPPGGENYADVAARVESWVRDLRTDTFAVSHGATTRILRGLFQGLTADQMTQLHEPQGVVFRVCASTVLLLPESHPILPTAMAMS